MSFYDYSHGKENLGEDRHNNAQPPRHALL